MRPLSASRRRITVAVLAISPRIWVMLWMVLCITCSPCCADWSASSAARAASAAWRATSWAVADISFIAVAT